MYIAKLADQLGRGGPFNRCPQARHGSCILAQAHRLVTTYYRVSHKGLRGKKVPLHLAYLACPVLRMQHDDSAVLRHWLGRKGDKDVLRSDPNVGVHSFDPFIAKEPHSRLGLGLYWPLHRAGSARIAVCNGAKIPGMTYGPDSWSASARPASEPWQSKVSLAMHGALSEEVRATRRYDIRTRTPYCSYLT